MFFNIPNKTMNIKGVLQEHCISNSWNASNYIKDNLYSVTFHMAAIQYSNAMIFHSLPLMWYSSNILYCCMRNFTENIEVLWFMSQHTILRFAFCQKLGPHLLLLFQYSTEIQTIAKQTGLWCKSLAWDPSPFASIEVSSSTECS